MILKLIDESQLSVDVKNDYVVVFFKQHPDVYLGKQKIDYVDGDVVEKFSTMPGDLIDEKYFKLYDGIVYIGGIISPIKCYSCSKKLYYDEYTVHEEAIQCFYCGQSIKIKKSSSLNDLLL
ncbi:hypothetical protein PRVXH_001203 [Proteinivorax hydrogeniformans]|uniref:Uncharacterized protein n=1 Tax=Proteinivorax hydrogeniformans TaxID=1826727 RepID=A0AAU8HWQ7_9FIRM